MVTVALKGGLGNQMFQYALGRHLSLRRGTRLILDATLLLDPLPRFGQVPRGLDLDVFELPAECSLLSRAAQRMKIPRVYYWLSRGLTAVKAGLGIQAYYRERSLRYDPAVLECPGNVYLDGYWQSEKYFGEVAAVIRRDFRLRPGSARVALLGSRIAATLSVCVNVRRADFLGISARTHGFVGMGYYRRALSYVADLYPSAEYFVFSDDIEWCSRELVRVCPGRCSVVGHEYAGRKFSDYLWLMSQCQHFVIPNSTFGWWAAWLSTREGKMVIAPRRWFCDEALEDCDIVPCGWLRM